MAIGGWRREPPALARAAPGWARSGVDDFNQQSSEERIVQLQSLLLAATLLAPATASEPPTPPPSYAAMLAEVEALTEAINAGEPVRDQLFDALAEFPRHAPSLAADPDARAIRARAQLNLARTYLSEGARESAAGVMDEILRSTQGEALSVDEFGPSLAALYADRRAALEREGTANLEIRCRVPCRVYVNERAAGQRVEDLYLGIYRVWIEREHGDSTDSHSEWVKLSEPNETVVVEFRASERPPYQPPKHERLMPRAVEITLLLVGGTAVTAGGLLLGVDADAGPNQQIAGAALTGVGGAALLLGGVSLSIDEVRLGDAKGRQATINWRVNF
jgi:hypothetical protein